MIRTRITFIGCGNMARSLIGGLVGNGYPRDLLCGADPDTDQREQITRLFDIVTLADNRPAVQGAGVVVLAVKPQVVYATLRALAEDLKANGPLILSIAAGVPLAAISRAIGGNLPVVRVMPNTPALIRAGAAALFANEHVDSKQHELAEAIMRSVGIAIWLDNESSLDAVTALSGSGPAYFFLVMEALEKAAVKMGLDAEQARLLTLETAFGAAKMALESTSDPATLRLQVTSPGGTTERALGVLLDGNIMRLFEDALNAARNRSMELAREFENE